MKNYTAIEAFMNSTCYGRNYGYNRTWQRTSQDFNDGITLKLRSKINFFPYPWDTDVHIIILQRHIMKWYLLSTLTIQSTNALFQCNMGKRGIKFTQVIFNQQIVWRLLFAISSFNRVAFMKHRDRLLLPALWTKTFRQRVTESTTGHRGLSY